MQELKKKETKARI